MQASHMPLVQTKLPYRTAAELADTIRVLRDRVAQLERELKEARKQSAAAPPKQTSVLALLMQVRGLLFQGAWSCRVPCRKAACLAFPVLGSCRQIACKQGSVY